MKAYLRIRRSHFRTPLLLIATGILIFTHCTTPDKTTDSDKASANRLIGYVLGDQNLSVKQTDANLLTHINYAFANVTENGDVVLEHTYDSTNIARLTALRNHNPDLKILLSIGGWVWSDYFSNAALTEESRIRFARTAVGLMTKYRLDGLDIDWEYPGQPGEDNIYRPEDKKNFTLLLKTVREHLDRKSDREAGNKHYLLTIAAGTNDLYQNHTNMAEVQRYLDFVNLMTYDFHGSWTDHTGHHSNLFPPSKILDGESSTEASVKSFIQAGVPAHKIVLGVPFYGRGWAGVNIADNGLHQSYSKPLGGFSYDSLANHIIGKNGFVRHWDETSKAPYLWNPDSTIFITYEDKQSLKFKANYVKENKLGGLMYWEHKHDPDRILLNALNSYF
jgi:chitinase